MDCRCLFLLVNHGGSSWANEFLGQSFLEQSCATCVKPLGSSNLQTFFVEPLGLCNLRGLVLGIQISGSCSASSCWDLQVLTQRLIRRVTPCRVSARAPWLRQGVDIPNLETGSPIDPVALVCMTTQQSLRRTLLFCFRLQDLWFCLKLQRGGPLAPSACPGEANGSFIFRGPYTKDPTI